MTDSFSDFSLVPPGKFRERKMISSRELSAKYF